MASPSDPSSSGPPSSEPRSPATTSATPPTFYEAAHAVLNTNELLCEIISYLPLEDIVATTGVCRTWRAALKASKAIQQALFLAPIDIRRTTTRTKVLSQYWPNNPPREIRTVVGQVNPFLARICGPELPSDEDHDTIFPEHLVMSPRRDFKHPIGLWRDMFITQPPTSEVMISLFPDGPLCIRFEETQEFVAESRDVLSIRCDEGMRMGQLYDCIGSIALAFSTKVAVGVFMPTMHQEHSLWCWGLREGISVRQFSHSGREFPYGDYGESDDP